MENDHNEYGLRWWGRYSSFLDSLRTKNQDAVNPLVLYYSFKSKRYDRRLSNRTEVYSKKPTAFERKVEHVVRAELLQRAIRSKGVYRILEEPRVAEGYRFACSPFSLCPNGARKAIAKIAHNTEDSSRRRNENIEAQSEQSDWSERTNKITQQKIQEERCKTSVCRPVERVRKEEKTFESIRGVRRGRGDGCSKARWPWLANFCAG